MNIPSNFYPTPAWVSDKMLNVVREHFKSQNLDQLSLLEPSAGCGDILEFVSSGRHSYDKFSIKNVYCIEDNPDFVSILRDKGFSVIGNDFLKYSGELNFDAILMNPPFENGDKHLLKAWEILHNGIIVCLLNQETIDNPFSKTRQLLAKIIADNNGQVEYLGDCFSNAERKTDVRVAMVTLTKKAASGSFFDFKKLDLQEVKDNVAEQGEDGVEKYSEINKIVGQYKASKCAFLDMMDGYQKFSNSLKLLNLGNYLEEKLLKHLMDGKEGYNSAINKIRKEFWKKVLRSGDFSRHMTQKVSNDFEKFQETEAQKEFNKENILNILFSLIENKTSVMTQAVLDAFDVMTAYHYDNRCHFEGWKTNCFWKVGQKVILPFVVDASFRNYFINFSREAGIRDIEKAFCFLSGKNVNNILSIECVVKNIKIGDASWHDTEFFEIKCFKKGTIHLKFNDLKLLDTFNKVACKNKFRLGGGFGTPAKQHQWDDEKKVPVEVPASCSDPIVKFAMEHQDVEFLFNRESLELENNKFLD